MSSAVLRRPTAAALVLAVLSSLLVLAPAAAPGLLPGSLPAAEATPVPPPAQTSDLVSITGGGRFSGAGSTVTVDAIAGRPACNTFQDSQFQPAGCWTSASITGATCASYDLWTESAGQVGSCPGMQRSTTTSTGTTADCTGSGNFGIYVYGNNGSGPGSEWSSYGPSLISGCDLTLVADPTGTWYGPAWRRAAVSIHGWNDWAAGDDYGASADVWIPMDVEISNKGPIVECDATPTGNGATNLTSSTRHPLGYGNASYQWYLGGNSGEEEGPVIAESASIVYDWPPSGPPNYSPDYITLVVTDTDGRSGVCVVFRPEEPDGVVDVTLARADGASGPVEVGDPFDVTVEVAAPATNESTLTDVDLLGEALDLPNFLTVVETDIVGGFSLPVDSQESFTATLRATGPGTGPLTSTWTAVDGGGLDISGAGSLDVTAVGTLTGEWFRQDLLGDHVREGETVDIRLRVDNQSGGPLTDVALVDARVMNTDEETDTPPDEDPADRAELTAAGGALRGTLDANGIGSVDFLDFTLQGLEAGDVTLVADLIGTNEDDEIIETTVEAIWEVKDQPLAVEVIPHVRRADGSAMELNTDNDGDGDIDLDDHRFDVTVRVTNDTDDTLTDLAFLDPTEPVDFSNNLIGEDQGAPKLTLLGTRGDPVMVEGVQQPGPVEELDVEIPDLTANGEEGDTHEVTYVYEATGEINATGASIVNGKSGELGVRGSGTADVVFTSGLLLEFTSWLLDPFRLTTSGQVVRMGGYIENLDEDELDESGAVIREAKPFAVWITPMTTGNAGGGYLVDREGGQTPLGAEYIEVAPGERKQLHGILVTTPAPTRTDAFVEYRVSAWNLPETAADKANPVAQERIDMLVNEESGLAPNQTQRLRFNEVGSQALQACETRLYDAIVTCNFYEGVVSMLTSTVDAAKLAHEGVGQIGQATYWTGAWAMDQLGDIAAALNDDPLARARLAQEIEVSLSAWNNIALDAGDAGVGAVAVLDDFIRETERVVKEGDVEAGLAYVSRFAGENPDMLYGAVLKARTLAAMGQSALRAETRSTAASVVREAVEAEAQAASRELVERVDGVIAQGLDPKIPANGAIVSGLDVTDTPKVYRDVYGASQGDVRNMLQIAKEEGILIAFRSRSPISLKLLEDGLAWLKPQSVKAKNVNAMDVAYFGFPQDSLGRVAMMEPPIDASLVGDALERALDDHMDVLTRNHPELADPVWAGEVRDRLKMRTTKYREHLYEWRTFAEEGMPVGFGYSENGITTGADVSELRDVRLKVTEVPNRYGEGTLKKIELEVAGPGGTDFRPLTGDIDIVGFFNLDRSPIMEAGRRERIYEKMRSLLGMQHGETLTWDHQKRAELLREHVGPDAETLLVASPDERLYTSTLDVAKSSDVAPGGNFADTFSLLDGPPKELKSPARAPGPAPSGRLVSIADDPRTLVQQGQAFTLPGRIEHLIDGIEGGVADTQTRGTEQLVVRPDGRIERYVNPGPSSSSRSSAPIADTPTARGARDAAADLVIVDAILGDYTPYLPRPAVGAAGGRWVPISLADAVALGEPGRLELPVGSWTELSILPGDTELSVLTPADLGVTGGEWFAIGDRIVVDPGGLYEQIVTVTSVDGGRLGIDAALTHRQPDGVAVNLLVAAPATGGPTTPTTPTTPTSPTSPTSPTTPAAPGPPTPALPSVERLAGDTRLATAIAISQAAYPEADSAAAVVLARSDVFADGLAGIPFTVAQDAPLLLTPSTVLDATVLAEINRVVPAGAPVWLLGGEQALNPVVADALAASGYDVHRLAGPTRYDTAVAIGERVGDVDTVYVARGTDFPDALAAGPAAVAAGGVVLLTGDDGPTPVTEDYLLRHPDVDVFAVGGAAARAFPAAVPLVGETRVQTAIAVADASFPRATRVGLSRDDAFADALAGGVLAGREGAPILLVRSDALPDEVADWLTARTGTVQLVDLFGGSVAISVDVERRVATLLGVR